MALLPRANNLLVRTVVADLGVIKWMPFCIPIKMVRMRVSLESGIYVTEGKHLLPLANGDLLYKSEAVLMKITKDGIDTLYEELHWPDHRWMQESWVQGADGNVYALRYNINTKQVMGVVKVNLDGSGVEYHPIHVNQFNGVFTEVYFNAVWNLCN